MAVKVILRQDVPNLGNIGEVKQVTPGYFRNFLLPRGLAVEATAGNMKSLQSNSKVKDSQVARQRERIEGVAGTLAGLTLRFPVKVGEQGRLYGSITSKDIAEAIHGQAGVEVDRHKIDLSEPLRSVGNFSVPIKLDHGVNTSVQVELVPESETA